MSLDETIRRRKFLTCSGLILTSGCAGVPSHIHSSDVGSKQAEVTFDGVWCTSSSGNISPATLVDERLYVGTTERNSETAKINCFDVMEHSKRWSVEVDQPVVVKPRIAYGHVYFGTKGGILYAVSTDDGTVTWEYDTKTGLTDTEIAIGNQMVYLGGDSGNIVAVSATQGERQWQTATQYEKSVPVLDDGSLYVGTGDFGSANTSDNTGMLFAFTPENGTVQWKTPVKEPVVTQPAVTENRIYTVGSTRGGVFAFDSRTGEKRWSRQTYTSILAPPVAVNDTLYVGTTGGEVYAFSIPGGNERWTYESKSAIRAPVAVSSRRVYVGDNAGSVHVLDQSSGEKQSELTVQYDYVSSLNVNDDSIYIVSNESIGVGDGELCEYRQDVNDD